MTIIFVALTIGVGPEIGGGGRHQIRFSRDVCNVHVCKFENSVNFVLCLCILLPYCNDYIIWTNS